MALPAATNYSTAAWSGQTRHAASGAPPSVEGVAGQDEGGGGGYLVALDNCTRTRASSSFRSRRIRNTASST